MEKLKIAGGYPLKGSIRVSGAKNSAVALIPATILADSPVTIEGLPDISDVQTLKELLEEIGGKVHFEDGEMTVDPCKNGFHAIAKWKSEKTSCFLLFNGCNAWKV